MIQLKNIERSYKAGVGQTWVLRRIQMDIRPGEFITIMGPSGSGKSTLLHLMGALDQPTSGRVVLAGQDISLLADKPLTLFRRKHLGFVFQFFNLLPTMTAAENAALPAMLAGASARDAEVSLQPLVLSHHLAHLVIRGRSLSRAETTRDHPQHVRPAVAAGPIL